MVWVVFFWYFDMGDVGMSEIMFCCVIYICKFLEEGLDQDFNLFDVQCEVCEVYIVFQCYEGWK